MTNTTIDTYDYSGNPAKRVIDLADSIEGHDALELALDNDDRIALKADFTFRNSEGDVIDI